MAKIKKAKKLKASGPTIQQSVTVGGVQRKETLQVVDATKLIARLSEHSTAMELKPHLWRGTVTDDTLKGVLVAHCEGSAEAFTNPTLKIMPPDIRQSVTSKITEATSFFKRYSVPYGATRIRLIPNSIYAEVRRELDGYNVELKRLGDDVANQREKIVAWAKEKLAKAYKDDMVPSEEVLRTKCYLDIQLSSISMPAVITGVDNAEELKQEIAKSMADQFAKGFGEVIRGVIDQFKDAKAALSKEDQKSVRYQTLVEGFIKTLKRMATLNIGQNEDVQKVIDKAVESVQKLANLKDKLKKDKSAREEAIKEMTSAEEALSNISLN